MTISIAMATYNGETYLQEQLDSFATQTLLPDELIVCDDGSSDRTLDILYNFAADVPFKVEVYQNDTNLGYVKNFEKAISLCSGDIVFFCDQDDVWFPKKIEHTSLAFQHDPDLEVYIHNMQVINEKEKLTIMDYFRHLASNGFTQKDHLKGCCMAVRRITLANFVSGRTCKMSAHDAFFYVIGNARETLMYDNTILIMHRIHGTNLSGRLKGNSKFLSKLLRRLSWKLLGQDRNDLIWITKLNPKMLNETLELLPDLRLNSERFKKLDEPIEKRREHLNKIANLYHKSVITQVLNLLWEVANNLYRGGGGIVGLKLDVSRLWQHRRQIYEATRE